MVNRHIFSTRPIRTRAVKVLLLFYLLVIVILIGLGLCGFRINVTKSYPIGVWKLVQGQTKKGQIVFFCPENNEYFKSLIETNHFQKGSCSGGYRPLIKQVAGVPGDKIETDGNIVKINGKTMKNSRILEHDINQWKIPRIAFSGYIPDGYVWLMSDYSELSFDSRYFGLIPVNNIKGPIKLIWEW